MRSVSPPSSFETISASLRSLRMRAHNQHTCCVALILRDREAIVSKDEGALTGVATSTTTGTAQ